MKTVSTRDFFHTPALVKGLQPGESIMVTAKGKPEFIVTKAGDRPRKPIEELDREAKAIKGKKFDVVEFLKDQRR